MDEEELNEYEEAPSLFHSEEELDFDNAYDREEGHIYESIEADLEGALDYVEGVSEDDDSI